MLPQSVVQFLGYCLGWTQDQIRGGWDIFGTAVWETGANYNSMNNEVLEFFKKHGHGENFAYYNLYPPQTKCSNAVCPNYCRGLLRRKDDPRKVNVHMLHGSHIAYSIHLMPQLLNKLPP